MANLLPEDDRDIPNDDWDLHKDSIRQAYLVQIKSLVDIRAFLKKDGFEVTLVTLNLLCYQLG